MKAAMQLSPPAVRQPYTPPPQFNQDSEAGHSRRGSGKEIDMAQPSLDIDAVNACVGSTADVSHKRTRSGSPKSLNEGSQSLAGALRKGIVQHQLGLAVNLLLVVALSWVLFPSIRERVGAFFLLSYKAGYTGETVQTSLYGPGLRDIAIVTTFVVFFTGLRAAMLDYVLGPLASALGIKKPKGKVRFAEQSYLLLYYIVYWTWGVYLFWRDTPAALPPDGTSGKIEALLISMWTQFPKLYLDGYMKIYYLSQLAFWIQQILVIHLEERRKDHSQMLTHHFVTVALMSTSYCYRQWRVGNAVLVCMDIVDLIFPVSPNLTVELTLQRMTSDEMNVPARKDLAVPRPTNALRPLLRALRRRLAPRASRSLPDHLLEHLRPREPCCDALRHILARIFHEQRLIWDENLR